MSDEGCEGRVGEGDAQDAARRPGPAQARRSWPQRLAMKFGQSEEGEAKAEQATIIQMLKRPEGTTISQICEATGWQPHSVRGMFYGPTLKKLNISITSIKSADGVRVYHA